MSTHFLWQRGAARLKAWGLLDRLVARCCEPIKAITFDVGPVQLVGSGPAVGGVSNTYCPRRTVLDAVLVEAAVEAGVELIEGFAVRDLLWSEGRVAGVVGHDRGSRPSSLRSRVVVGADGLHSTIAKRVEAPARVHHPPLTRVHYSYWSGLRGLGAAFHTRPGRLVLVWPTNDDLTCIYVAWPHDESASVTPDVDGSFHAALELVPGLRDHVGRGERVQRFVGTGDLPNQYRVSAGPGWALVGDAGHHKDPSTGMGMSDAFLAADLLAQAIDDGLLGRQPMDTALAGYEQQRDALTRNGFELTMQTARLAPLSARLESFYGIAAERPELACQVFGVLGGSVPVPDVYSETAMRVALAPGAHG
jgi:flavin-dependent dehydrogenase